MPVIPPDLLTTTQAAARLRVKRSTVIHAIRDGRLPATHDSRLDRWFVTAASLDAYDQRRQRRARIDPTSHPAPIGNLADAPDLLTVAEAAALAGRTRQALGKAIRAGTLPTSTTGSRGPGRGHRILRDDLAAWIAGRK